jgi:hypothetical protein
MVQYRAAMSFRRTLPISESQVLIEIVRYLKRALGLVDAQIVSVEEADTLEPVAPAFEYRNVSSILGLPFSDARFLPSMSSILLRQVDW